MRSLFDKKTLVLLIAVLALGALTVLSFSLKSISFQDARPIGRREPTPFQPGAPQAVPDSFMDVSLKSQIMVWVALSLLAVLVALILSPEARKRLLRILIRVAFTYWALYFIFKRYPDLLSFLSMGLGGRQAAREVDEATASIPPPVFTPPRQTPLLSYLAGLLFMMVMVYLVWRLYRTWKRIVPSGPSKSLEEIARIARSSLRELDDGRESTDVIMNCYFRMNDEVAEKRNLQRGMSVTPAEFASHLVQAGLPSDAVRRLTNLFESVRYGGHRAGPREINEAVACLTAILQYCGEPL